MLLKDSRSLKIKQDDTTKTKLELSPRTSKHKHDKLRQEESSSSKKLEGSKSNLKTEESKKSKHTHEVSKSKQKSGDIKFSTKHKSLKLEKSKKKEKGKEKIDVKVSRTYHKRRTHTVEVDREFEFSVETSDSPQAQEKSTDRDDFDSDFVGGFDFECHEDDHIHNSPEFKTLSPDDIVVAQKKQISEICELLMISASSASLLLRFYGWKPEILIEKYFHDPEKVIQQAGILVDTFDGEAEAKLVDHGECLVCTDVTSPEESCALVCSHRVCVGCWSSFLTMKNHRWRGLSTFLPSCWMS